MLNDIDWNAAPLTVDRDYCKRVIMSSWAYDYYSESLRDKLMQQMHQATTLSALKAIMESQHLRVYRWYARPTPKERTSVLFCRVPARSQYVHRDFWSRCRRFWSDALAPTPPLVIPDDL